MKNQISKKQNSNKRLYLSKHKKTTCRSPENIFNFNLKPISCRKNLIFDIYFTREGNFFRGEEGVEEAGWLQFSHKKLIEI